MSTQKIIEGPEDEPEYIRRRAAKTGDSPLEKPATPATGGGEHRMGSISGYRKQSQIPMMVGDSPVSVRGPDEIDLSPGTRYVVARFNYRDRDRAMQGRGKLADAGGRDIYGPKADTVKTPGGEKLTYYYLEARFDAPDEEALGDIVRKLQSQRASKIDGPHREGARKKFQLVVQKRSGETETVFYASKEEAEKAKADIETQIRSNPVQGMAARRIRAGQSSIRGRGMSQGQYYSEKHTKKREHAAMIRDLGMDAARREIARDLGLDDETLRLNADYLRGHKGKKTPAEIEADIKRDRAEKKAQLDSYISSLLSMTAKQATTDRELEKLKPDFEGTTDGQVHRVTGKTQYWQSQYIDKKTGEKKKRSGQRQAKRDLEFMWYKWDEPRKVPKLDGDGEPVLNPKTGEPEMVTRNGEWLTPTQYSDRKRGVSPVTKRQGQDEPQFATGAELRAKRDPDRGGERSAGPVDPKRRKIAPSDPAYAEEYMRIFNGVGKYMIQSPLTKNLGEAMLAVERTVRAKGSPTVKSLERLSQEIENLRADFEEQGNELTKPGRERVMQAIDAGYRMLSQPPPVADEYEEDEPVEFDPDTVRAQGKSLGQQMAQKLGLAKGANEPKSVGKDFERSTGGKRKYVATSPTLPPALVQKIPYEYRKDRIQTWDDLHDLWGDRDVANMARLTGAPPQDTAWTALKKKLGKAFTTTADDLGEPESQGGQAPSSAWQARPPKKDTPDAPWRALSKVAKGNVPTGRAEPDDEDEMGDGGTPPAQTKAPLPEPRRVRTGASADLAGSTSAYKDALKKGLGDRFTTLKAKRRDEED